EAELLGLRTMVHLEAEQAREPFDRRVQVSHDDGQLYDVAQHGAPPWDGRARSYSRITSLDTSWPDQFPARRGSSTAGPSSRSRSSRWASASTRAPRSRSSSRRSLLRRVRAQLSVAARDAPASDAPP